MKLEGKKIAVLLENMYEDTEFWYPFIRMKEEGATVNAVAPGTGTYRGKHGVPATADMTVADADPGQFDALIIPGGYSPDRMRRHPRMVSFVRDMHEQDKVIAAICHAGWMLVSAGIVDGKKATSFFSIKDDLVNAGAKWSDEEVVIDGKLITSRTPDDLPAFCRAIISSMS